MSAERLRCPECRSLFWTDEGAVATCFDNMDAYRRGMGGLYAVGAVG